MAAVGTSTVNASCPVDRTGDIGTDRSGALSGLDQVQRWPLVSKSMGIERQHFPCTWDQNAALSWEFNGNRGHGPVARTWHITPAIDPDVIRRAWVNLLIDNPALTVEYSLAKDGFWYQSPRPTADLSEFVVEVPYCDAATLGLIMSQTGPFQDRIHTLVVDSREASTTVTFVVDHVPIDGYSFRRVIHDFGKYLSGAESSGGRDGRFFEFCKIHGATSQTSGPLKMGNTITPYEPIPRSRVPANTTLCATAIRKFTMPLDRIPERRRTVLAGIGPAIGAAAVARAAAEPVDEIPTLVTLPNRRPSTYDAFGRFLGYTMIGLPSVGPDLLDTAAVIYHRILAAGKPSAATPPMSRVVAALAPHRISSKFKPADQMLPYMAIDHSEPERPLTVAGHYVEAEEAEAAIYLGAYCVYTSADAHKLSFTVALRTDHLSMSVFDSFEELVQVFPNYADVRNDLLTAARNPGDYP